MIYPLEKMLTRPCWMEGFAVFPVLSSRGCVEVNVEFCVTCHFSLEPSSQPRGGQLGVHLKNRGDVYVAQQGPMALAILFQ